ncbi:uncharacterized protein LOC116940340 [Petromyzon marinus]|uniref:uncharacterized protein LOC116940340 n=1 Tax=Petromyzon marinus TaxID=7757 RepID=UPI003F71DBCE
MASPPKLTGETLIVHHIPLVHCQVPAVRAQGIMGKRAAPFSLTSDLGSQGSVSLSGSRTINSSSNSSSNNSNNSNSSSNNSTNNGDGGHVRGREKAGLSSPCSTAVASLPDGTAQVQDSDSPRLSGPCGTVVQNDPRRMQQSSFHLHNNKNRCMTRWRSLSSQLEGGCGVTIAADGQVTNTSSRARSQVTGNGRAGNRFNRASSCPDGHNGNNVRFKRLSLQCQGKGLSIVRDIDNADVGGYRSRSSLTNELLREAEEMLDNCNESGAEDNAPVEGFEIGGGGTHRDPAERGSRSAHDNDDDGGCDGDYGGDDADCERNGYASLGDANYEYCENDGPHGGGCGGCGEYECSMCSTRISDGSARTELSDFGGDAPGGRRDVDKGSDGDVGRAPTGSSSSMQWSPLESESFYLDLHSSPCGSQRTGGGGGSSSSSPSEPFTVRVDRELRSASALDYDADADGNLCGTGDRAAAAAPGGLGAGGGGGAGRAVEESAADDDDGLGVGRASAAAGGRDSPLPGASGSRGEARLVQAMQNYYRLVTVDLSTQSTPSHTAVCSSAESSASSEGPGGAAFGPAEASTEYYLFDRPRAGGEGATPVDEAGGRRSCTSPALARGRFGDAERDGGESQVATQQQRPEEEASGQRVGVEASGKVAEREVPAIDENSVLDSMDFASWAERFKTHPHERDDSLGEGLRCRESPKDSSLKTPTRDDESQMLELTTWSFRSKTSIESRQESLTDSPQSSNGAYREGEKDEDMLRGFDIRPYKHVCGLNTCHSFPRHITPSLRQRSKSYDQSLGRKPLQGIVSFNRLLSCPSELSQGPASQQATPQKRVTSFAKIAQSRKKGGGPSPPPPPPPQCRHSDLASMQITPIDERSSLGNGPYDSAGSACRVTDEAAGGALDGSPSVGRSLSRRSNPFQSEPNLPQSSGGGKVPSSASFTLNGRAVPEYLQTWSPSPPYACPADDTTGSGGEEDGSGGNGGGGALPKGRREEAARAGASAGTRGEVCGECADGQRRDADVMGASGGGRSWALREGHATAGLGTNPGAKTTTPTQYGKEHRPTTLPIQPFILHHHLSRQLAARPFRPARGAPQQPSAALPLARGQPQPPASDPAGSGGPPPPASAAHGRSAPLGHPGGQLPLQISRPTLTGTRLAALGSSQSLGGSQGSRDVALQQSLGEDGGDGAARLAQRAADARDSGSDSDQWNSDGGAALAVVSAGTARQSLVCECRSRRRWRPPPGAIRPSPLGSLSPIRADLLLLASASPTRATAAAGAGGALLPPQPPPPPRSSSYPPTIATYSCGLALAGDSSAEQSPAGSSVPGRCSSSKLGGFLGNTVAAPAASCASPKKAGGSGGGVFGGETWRPQPLKRSPRFTSLQANSSALGPPQGHSQRAAATTSTARHLAETRWGGSEAPRPLRDGPAAERVGDGGRFHSSCATSRASQGTLIQPASDLEVLWHGRRGCRSSSSPAVRCGSFPHRASSSWASRTRAHTQGPSARPLQAYYSDFCPDYFSMAERPPHEFCLSPDDSDSSTSIDLLEKRALVQTVNSAIDLIVAHFGTTRDPGVKAKLGDSAVSPNVGHLVLKYLCPALSNVLKDGLRPHLLDLIVGRRRNTPWSVVESSTQLGPSTKRLHGLYQHLCQLTELSSQSMRFNAFILGLLNMKSLDFWISYLHNHEGILTTHYLPEGFLAMPSGACAPLVDELVLLLQPLALLPFRLDERFEFASGEQQREQIRQHERLRSQFESLQRSVHSTFQFMRHWSNPTAAGAADATDAAVDAAAAVPGEGVVGRTMNELAADAGVRGSYVSPDGGEDRVAAIGLSDRSEKDLEGFDPNQEQSLYSSCQELRDDVVEGDVGREKRSAVAEQRTLPNVSALRDDAEIDKAPNQMVTCAECKHSASGVQSQEAEKPQEGGESRAEHSLVQKEEERASACGPAAVSNKQPTSSQWQSRNVDWWQQLKESSQIYLTAEREGGGPKFSRWNRPHSFTYVKAGELPEKQISKSAEPHKGHSPDGRNFAQGGKETLPTPDAFRVSREPTRKSGGQDYLKKTPPSDPVAGEKKRGWLGSPPDSDDLDKPLEGGQAVERRGGDVEAPQPPAVLWLGRLFGASPHRQQQQKKNAKDVQTLRSPQINRLPSSWLGLDMSTFGLVPSLPVATETNQATLSPDNGGSVSAGATTGAQSLAARPAHETSPRERGSTDSRVDRVREVTALCHHAAADRGQPSVRRGDVPQATGAVVPGRLLRHAQGGQTGPAPGAAGFVSTMEDSER